MKFRPEVYPLNVLKLRAILSLILSLNILQKIHALHNQLPGHKMLSVVLTKVHWRSHSTCSFSTFLSCLVHFLDV